MVIQAKAFFDLQLRFADSVATLSALPLSDVLLKYTNFYIRFGLGRDFNASDPTWQAYLAGLKGPARIDEWTYGFYSTRRDADAGPAVVATTGCFSYARLSGERIRLHFHDADQDGRSPLAIERVSRRRAELAGLFDHVKRAARTPLRVVGASWLYNLAAYRRLFPSSYLATTRPMPRCFQHLPLWGQFLDRHGALREKRARDFLMRLGHQSSVDDLDRCFPLQALSVEAPVQDFYDFYGVS
jgi:hypothetical protein